MQRFTFALFGLFIAAMVVLGVNQADLAQSSSVGTAAGSLCKGFTPEILSTVNTNCGQERLSKIPGAEQSACYAAGTVEFSLTGSELPSPGSVLASDAVESLRTIADGIAVMNLQSTESDNAPYRLVAMGDAEVEPATSGDFSSMFIRTSTEGCGTGVPSAIAIENLQASQKVALKLNGITLTQGSTSIFRILPPGNTLQVLVTEGEALLQAGTSIASVTAGNVSVICLAEPEDLGADGNANDQIALEGCNWIDPRPMTEEELAFAAAVQAVLGEPTSVVTSGGECANGGKTLTHTVRSGETLGRIAARYSTTVTAIATENKIANINTIFPGQVLTISCAVDTGSSTVPPAYPTLPPPPVTR